MNRFPCNLLTLAVQASVRNEDKHSDHVQLLRLLDSIKPVAVDAEKRDEWVRRQAKAAGVTAITGQWRPVPNSGRRISQLEGIRVSVLSIMKALGDRPMFMIYKSEPGQNGPIVKLEMRVGIPWEGAKIVAYEKMEEILELVADWVFEITTAWGNPFVPEGGTEDDTVCRVNLVMSSVPVDGAPNSKDVFELVQDPDGYGLLMETEFGPSRYANKPGPKPAVAA